MCKKENSSGKFGKINEDPSGKFGKIDENFSGKFGKIDTYLKTSLKRLGDEARTDHRS